MQEKSVRKGAAGYVALVAALILFYRFPDRLLDGFLWAEDGRLFLPDAYQYGFRAISQSYEGYLHALPRLLAYLAARFLPITWIPSALPVVCLALVCAGSALIYRAALRLPWRSNPAAWSSLIALSPALIPHSGEVFLTITNLQWIAAPVLLGLLYMAPSIRGKRVLLAAVAVQILAMTGPFSVLMMPFVVAIIALKFRRPVSRASVFIFAAYAAGTAAQIVAMMLWARDPAPPGALVGILDAAMRDLIGPAFLPRALLSISEFAEIGATLLLALAVVLTFWKSPARFELLVVLLFGLGVWAAGMAKIGSGARLGWNGDGARYTYLAYVFFAWSLAIGAGSSALLIGRRISAGMGVAMLLVSASLLVPPPHEKTEIIERADGGYDIHLPPQWKGKVRAGKLRVRT